MNEDKPREKLRELITEITGQSRQSMRKLNPSKNTDISLACCKVRIKMRITMSKGTFSNKMWQFYSTL